MTAQPGSGQPRIADPAKEACQHGGSQPIYGITNQEAAMTYFRANALTRLMAANAC